MTTPPNENGDVQNLLGEVRRCDRHLSRRDEGRVRPDAAAYDPRFGVALSETDVPTRRSREPSMSSGDSPASGGLHHRPICSCSTASTARSRGRSLQRDVGASGLVICRGAPITAVTIVDGLGRPVAVRKTAVVDGSLGMATSGLVARDSVGRTVLTYQPF